MIGEYAPNTLTESNFQLYLNKSFKILICHLAQDGMVQNMSHATVPLRDYSFTYKTES